MLEEAWDSDQELIVQLADAPEDLEVKTPEIERLTR